MGSAGRRAGAPRGQWAGGQGTGRARRFHVPGVDPPRPSNRGDGSSAAGSRERRALHSLPRGPHTRAPGRCSCSTVSGHGPRVQRLSLLQRKEGRGVNRTTPGWEGRAQWETKPRPWGSPGGVGVAVVRPGGAPPSMVSCPLYSVCRSPAVTGGLLCCADLTRKGLRPMAGPLRADELPSALDPAVCTPPGRPTGQEGRPSRLSLQQGQASAPRTSRV